ncbi:reticulocyte-binding protein homolog 2a-like [Macrobrachium nipponense]|uniref:reticulocyte-binding protein homolog 2a-like n=1 Tax=Macrobrachium nipponense TaxID=159736 RepID=UPI0030C7C083
MEKETLHRDLQQREDSRIEMQLRKCKAELVEKKEELEKLKEENLQKDRELLRLENECTLKQMEVIRLQKASQTVVAENPKANGKLNEIRRRKVQLEFELAEAKEELETTEFEKIGGNLGTRKPPRGDLGQGHEDQRLGKPKSKYLQEKRSVKE